MEHHKCLMLWSICLCNGFVDISVYLIALFAIPLDGFI